MNHTMATNNRYATEQMMVRALMGLVTLASAALIAISIIVIISLFTPAHYWDQWEMVKHVAQGAPFSLKYLFQPHNEHIIATSKFLFYIDLWMFGYSNRSLILAIIFLHLSVSYSLSSITIRQTKYVEKALWFSIFGAMMLSLAQWENLTIGFQTQFGLTCFFAVSACRTATRFVDAREDTLRNLVLLFMSTALTVFSMGNGVALAASFTVVALLVRAPVKKNIIIIFLVYTVCLVIFVLQRTGTASTTHFELNNLPRLLEFFFAVLGGTIVGKFSAAVFIGCFVLAIYIGTFVLGALRPRISGRKVDDSIVIFLSIGAFALGSAAAITLGRFSLGPSAALASRYATPNILLYCSLLGALCSAVSLQLKSADRRMHASVLFGLTGLVLACSLVMRPAAIQQLRERSESLTSAGYFVLQGVRADSVLSVLYPDAGAIRSPIEYLRANKLNIFSDKFGLAVPNTSRIENVSELPACQSLDISPSSRLEPTSWKISGFVGRNQYGDNPAWLIATDTGGDVVGFAPPAMREVEGRAAFSLPVHNENPKFSRKVYAVARWENGEMCRKHEMITLPAMQLLRTLPTGVTASLNYGEQISLAGDAQKLPDAVKQAEQSLRVVRSTWQGDDSATGRITFILPSAGSTCPDAYVGVLRGPTSEGLAIEAGQGEVVETIALDSISEHEWWWLKIRNLNSCLTTTDTFVRLVDNGRAWGAWAAISAPFSISPSSSK